MKADPDLVLKVHSLLAESNPAVLSYAAQLGDEHVIREYLKNFPNEVYNNVCMLTGILLVSSNVYDNENPLQVDYNLEASQPCKFSCLVLKCLNWL